MARDKADALTRLLAELKRVHNLNAQELVNFSWQVVDHLKVLMTQEADPNLGQLEYQRTHRLLSVLKNSPQRRLFEEILTEQIRQALFNTGEQLRVVLENIWKKKFIWPFNKWSAARQVSPYLFGAPTPEVITLPSLWTDPTKDPSLKSPFYPRRDHLNVICASEICSLTPFDIAYIGHLEILRIEDLQARLKASFADPEGQTLIQLAGQAALALYDNPGDKPMQRQLARSVSDLYDLLSNRFKQQKQLIDRLSHEVALLHIHLEEIKEKLSATPPLELHDIFKAKFEADLEPLKALQVKTEALLAHQDELAATLQRVNKIHLTVPRGYRDNWQESAEQIIFALDRLQGI